MNRREFLKTALVTGIAAALGKVSFVAAEEEAETEPGCIIQWLSPSRALMVTDRGDVFSTIDAGAIWHECTVHVDLPGDDPWESLMDWSSQYDVVDLLSMAARAEVIHEDYCESYPQSALRGAVWNNKGAGLGHYVHWDIDGSDENGTGSSILPVATEACAQSIADAWDGQAWNIKVHDHALSAREILDAVSDL